MTNELNIEQLYRICDPTLISYKASDEAPELDTIIGQERALRALRFGLDIPDKGFHVFVAGVPGTGRTTAIERYLNEFASKKPVPSDWCYVNNFADSLEPNALRMPPGKAVEFQNDMERTVNTALEDLQAAFQADEYTSHKEELINSVQRQKQEILTRLGVLVQEAGFILQPTPMGLLTIPTRAGRPISEEEFLHLSPEEKKAIGEKQQQLKTALEDATRAAQSLDRDLRQELEKLDTEVASYTIKHHFDTLKIKYSHLEEIPDHIEHVRKDILKNVGEFNATEEQQMPAPFGSRARQSPTQKYGVKVLVDNSKMEGAPVIVEMNPTYNNLIGRVEHEAVFGALITNFTLVRAGCLHLANGGYLVLPIEDLLRNTFAWDALKRALANKEIVIEDMGERIGFATKTLRPEPIPLDVKVVLIGRPDLYQLLLRYDEQFGELFKVKADFDIQMPRTEDSIREYVCFAGMLCNAEGLKHLDKGALARVVEHGSRLADDQEKLSTRFGEMSDIIREASYYASSEGKQYTTSDHIERAVEERFYRSSLLLDRLHEMVTRDQIKIDVDGEKVGQVNGLSVLNLGDITFGQPSRITASISLGKDGVINIEREAEMSGPIHTKGVLILSGYLAEKYAQDKPLSLSARLVFEQSYSGVEGDSASSTELYALLSALSGLPIRQGIAVTGSVNQKGEVQVIGGVNQKIEGFFEICRAKGLTGKQGVMIPAGNVANLMLKKPVVEAVQQGKFHLWAVNTIDEGIQVLTGVIAGERDKDGKFETETVNALVDSRLNELAMRLSKFGKDENDKK